MIPAWLLACSGPTTPPDLTHDVAPPTGSTASTGGTGAPTASSCGPLVWAQRIGNAGSDAADDLVPLPGGGFAVSGAFSYTTTVGS